MPFRESKSWGQAQPSAGSLLDWGDPINKNIAGRWLCNEGAGGYVFDSAYNGTGTLTNGPTWNVGKPGRTVAVDGTNDFVTIPNSSKLNFAAPISISIWVYLTRSNTGTAQQLMIKWVSGTFWLLQETGNNFEFVPDASTAGKAVAAISGINVWRHVVGTYDLANIKIYRDGILIQTTPYSTALGASTGAITLGALGQTGPLQMMAGRLSNAGVWSRILRGEEVMRLYSEPYAGILAPRRRVVSQVVAAGTTPMTPHYYLEHIARAA